MNQAQFFEDFEALPPNAQQEIIDFAAFLKQRYSSYVTGKQEIPANSFFDIYSQLDIGEENNCAYSSVDAKGGIKAILEQKVNTDDFS